MAGVAMIDTGEIKQRMERQGLDMALNHLSQAESALQRREWESANAQIRSCLEGVFNKVAEIRLKSSKTGGDARKQLQTKGVLRDREAKLVQQFFNVAHGAGSHAGASNEDEARGRFLVGLGVCYLGLALIPELTRVEDVIAKAVTDVSRPTTDALIRTACPTCRQEQTLDEAELKRSGAYTVYICRNGCQRIARVGNFDLAEANVEPSNAPFAGYRVGNLVIHNANDLYVKVLTDAGQIAPREMLVPASPGALMR